MIVLVLPRDPKRQVGIDTLLPWVAHFPAYILFGHLPWVEHHLARQQETALLHLPLLAQCHINVHYRKVAFEAGVETSPRRHTDSGGNPYIVRQGESVFQFQVTRPRPLQVVRAVQVAVPPCKTCAPEYAQWQTAAYCVSCPQFAGVARLPGGSIAAIEERRAVEIVHVHPVKLQPPAVETERNIHFGIETRECPIGSTYVPPHIGKQSLIVHPCGDLQT